MATKREKSGTPGNIRITHNEFEILDFSDKKSLLEETYPELDFNDMSENEFDEYFDIDDKWKTNNN